MARVLFYTGVLLLVISAVLLYLPTCFSIILAFLLFTAICLLFIFKKHIQVNGLNTMLIISLCFIVLGTVTLNTYVKPAEGLGGYKALVVGTVWEFPTYYEGYTVYEVKAESITPIYEDGQDKLNDIPNNIKLRLTDVNSLDLKVFEKVGVEVVFNPLGEYKASSLSNGVYAGGYICSLTHRLGENRPFYAVFYDLREYLKKLIYDNVNYDEASVVSAVLLGDRSRLDTEFYDNAKITGVSHVLVVSGMHLGIIFQVLFAFLAFFKLSNKAKSILLMAAVFVVCAVCGFTPSIMRAGLTYFVLALGGFFYRKPDALNSLGAATVIILFLSPFGVGNVSLLLSLFSTFGLLFVCPIVYEKLCNIISKVFKPNEVLKGILFSVCQTLSATVFTMPICIIYFGYISLVSPLTNLLIGYAMTLILGLSLLAVILLMLPSIFKTTATLPIVAICLLVRYSVYIINLFAGFEYAIVYTEMYYLIVWFIFALCLCIWILLIKSGKFKYSRINFSAVVGIVTALCVFASGVVYAYIPKNRLTVLSVGKGSSVVLDYNGEVVVVGAGDTVNDAKTIKNYLLTRGKRKIDVLILPSLTKEFSGGAPKLIDLVETGFVFHPSEGKYYSKISHIANEKFLSFISKSGVTLNSGIDVINYADSGVVINIGDFSVIIYYNNLNDADILKNDNNILVCVGNPDEKLLNNKYSHIVISGDQNTVNKIKQSNKGLVNANDCINKNYEIKLG